MNLGTSKTWYNLAQQADSGEVSIYIFDEIGAWGVTAKSFIEELLSVPNAKAINLHINSPGGDVFDALAIYNMLSRMPQPKRAYIEGMAASAASFIPMACNEIHMPDNAMMFIHNAWTMTAGDSEQLRQTADFLDRIGESIVNVYASRATVSREQIVEMMDKETWLSASDAKAIGLCTHIDSAVQIAAKFDASLYRHIPSGIACQYATKEKNEMDNEQKPVEQPSAIKPVAEVGESGGVAVVIESAPADPRAEFKQFLAAFGARASDYYGAGLSFADAEKQYLAAVEAENEKLKAQAQERNTKPAPFNPPAKVEADMTWPEALAACGGDYVAAKAKYPEILQKLKAKSK